MRKLLGIIDEALFHASLKSNFWRGFSESLPESHRGRA